MQEHQQQTDERKQAEQSLGRIARAVAQLKTRGVLLLPPRGATIRAVTHLDVTEADMNQASIVLREEML